MALTDEIPRARWALELARIGESERITEAVQMSRVVGVLGEAEVGKTETVRQTLGHSTPKLAVVGIDLDGAAGEEQLAFQIAREIARSYLGAAEFSTLKVGVLVPASIEAKRIELAEILGVDGLEESLRDWPSGRHELAAALAALERLSQRRETILWIDHLEAPGLTPRHPLDLDRLLWAVREMIQRLPGLSAVLSGRDAAEAQILGREAAFHQQGQWLTLDNPPPEAWQTVAAGLRVPAGYAGELAELTGGHPETMLLALLALTGGRSSTDSSEVLRQLASAAGSLVARAMQHARSLHRLGGQVLLQVAHGQGPYAAAQRGESPPQEIRKVLGRLQLAGLIRHDDGWSVVNPLIGIALRSDLHRAIAPDLELETELDPEFD
jgi:hypothetical protein